MHPMVFRYASILKVKIRRKTLRLLPREVQLSPITHGLGLGRNQGVGNLFRSLNPKSFKFSRYVKGRSDILDHSFKMTEEKASYHAASLFGVPENCESHFWTRASLPIALEKPLLPFPSFLASYRPLRPFSLIQHNHPRHIDEIIIATPTQLAIT